MRADELFARLTAENAEAVRAAAVEVDPPYFLASNVLRLRKAAGLTQEQLAAAAGITQPRIAEIESGDANPRLLTLSRLAAALGVPVFELLRPVPLMGDRVADRPTQEEAQPEPLPSRRRKVG